MHFVSSSSLFSQNNSSGLSKNQPRNLGILTILYIWDWLCVINIIRKTIVEYKCDHSTCSEWSTHVIQSAQCLCCMGSCCLHNISMSLTVESPKKSYDKPKLFVYVLSIALKKFWKHVWGLTYGCVLSTHL